MPRPKRAFQVAVVSPVRTDGTYAALLGVLDYTEQASDWQLVGQAHNPIATLEEIDLGGVDGVVGLFRDRRSIDIVTRSGVAAVNYSNAVGDIPMPRVGHDDLAIGHMGARHLLERGFSSFAFLAVEGVWYAQRRREGFLSVIEGEAGRRCDILDGLPEMPDRRDRLGKWLARLPKPVAIMACTDSWACQAIVAAGKLGLRVPHDVAVLGVDNDRWLTQISPVPMSSIDVNWRAIGRCAAEMLDGLLAGKPQQPKWIPPTGVAVRRSTDVVVAEDPVVRKALQYIRENCTGPITVEAIMEATGVARRTLETRLKQAIGQTPYAAICSARVERAKVMLAQSDAPIAAVASDCGFNRADQFFSIFKKLTGTTPGRYRAR
jgi:LacI family transcriptional regulator